MKYAPHLNKKAEQGAAALLCTLASNRMPAAAGVAKPLASI